MNILKLWLTNNSTIDLEVADDELDELKTELGCCMVNPLSLYTTQIGASEIVIPSKNIMFYEVASIVESDSKTLADAQ